MSGPGPTCPRCSASLGLRWFLNPTDVGKVEAAGRRCPDCGSPIRLRANAWLTVGAAALALAVFAVVIALGEALRLPDVIGIVIGGVAAAGAVFALICLQIQPTVPPTERAENLKPGEAIRQPSSLDAPFEDAHLLRRAGELEELYGYAAASQTALQEDPRFAEAVLELTQTEQPIEELVRLARDNRVWVSKIALGALATRTDVPANWCSTVLRRLNAASYDHAGLYLTSLTHGSGEVIGPVLSKVDQVLAVDLVRLISLRHERNLETFDAERLPRNVARSLRVEIEGLLEEYARDLPESVTAAFREWLAGQIDLGPDMNAAVQMWTYPFLTNAVLLEEKRKELAGELSDAIGGVEGNSGSPIVIGEHGVGKTTLIRKALEQAGPSRLAFEAGASALNAGASYVGQLEGRVEELVQRLQGRRVAWVFPSLQEALWAGAYAGDPRGLLDALLPHIERGSLRLIGEVTPEAYELLVNRRPRVASAFKALRVYPLDSRSTIAVCRTIAAVDLGLAVSDEVLRQAFEFSDQFLPGLSQPGACLRLLKATAIRVREQDEEEIATTNVLKSLSGLTGIPTEILDPSRPLGLARVRAFMADRVLGQEEAVDVVVERIALVKAGPDTRWA